jgi:hypothetical protein
MHKEIKTSIHINATPSTVWQVLTDFEKYPNWNPFIKEINGTVAQGASIQVNIDNMQFKPTIITCVPNEQLSWLGKLFIKGLFDGQHNFRLEAQTDGTTIFHHTEQFSGLLVRLFASKLETNTKAGFEAMNKKVKIIAEQQHTF